MTATVTAALALIIFAVIVLHKIHGLVAGVVFVAVLVPFFGMTGRYMQVNRRGRGHHYGRLRDDDGLRVNDRRRWSCAHFNATIDAGSDNAAYTDTYVGLRLRRPSQRSQAYGQTKLLGRQNWRMFSCHEGLQKLTLLQRGLLHFGRRYAAMVFVAN